MTLGKLDVINLAGIENQKKRNKRNNGPVQWWGPFDILSAKESFNLLDSKVY